MMVRNAAFPLTLRAILLPLMAGNTVVVKGSERIPKTMWAICDVFREAGLPAGCLNLIFHRPEDASQITTALIAHAAVKKVNFTGSSRVGSIVAATAGKHLKPVLMELGGKASSIVLDDADVQRAAESCVLAAFMNVGCLSSCLSDFLLLPPADCTNRPGRFACRRSGSSCNGQSQTASERR